MPGWNECSIYEDACRNKTCDHVTNKSRTAVPMDERIIDIVSANRIPFRVVYGKRQYRDGSYSSFEVVSFYDRRFPHTAHGQFVSDYNPETMLERERGYGLNLDGGVPNWTIDAGTMDLVRSWLIHHVMAG